MKILKFGGSSISDAARIKNVTEIIKESSQIDRIAVVVSALGGVTEKLIKLSAMAATGQKEYVHKLDELQVSHNTAAKSLIGNDATLFSDLDSEFSDLRDILHGISLVREVSPRLKDLVMSFGERLSSIIMADALVAQGFDAEALNMSQLIKTDRRFGNASVDFEITNRNIIIHFEKTIVTQIATGFIASTENGDVTTLGRGGSDYTAAILAAALKCSEVEIWTDVDGVMTADPRLVDRAFSIENMTYQEAMEMSHFGSKVIHPKAMQPAMEQNIPICIRNTFDPGFKGTCIGHSGDANGFIVRGISSISDMALLRVQGSGLIGVTGVSSRLFGALAKEKINVILITQGSSEHSICFAVEPESALLAKALIEQEFSLEILAHQIDDVFVELNLSVVAVVGEKMRGTPGIAARIFQAMAKDNINVVAIIQGSSELNITVVVDRDNESAALNAIHHAFLQKEQSKLHLFLVGHGLVGSSLLQLIGANIESPLTRSHLEIKINAIANTRKMISDSNGIPVSKWRALMNASEKKMNLDVFVNEMQDLKVVNKVFVDCTSDEGVVGQYEKILDSGISIVTPNKKANSGKYGRYRRLKEITNHRQVKFSYETNVGASLPIISTIRNLILCGDEIVKLEAVLSGTLSFIFNSFDGAKPFSEVVKEAQDHGYTEPDPREDLNGMDVIRKLLILARECDLQLELEDIKVDSILPEECLQAGTVDEFYAALRKQDDYLESQRVKASKAGKVLRHIASLENDEATVSLNSVDQGHPFYSMKGNENIIALTTKRYVESPLVIRGPGAGAELTASGVLADILQIGEIYCK